jgi:hypothetical protein
VAGGGYVPWIVGIGCCGIVGSGKVPYGSWGVGGGWWRGGFVGVVDGVVADAVVDAVADGFVDADTLEHDSE